ncbi:MAG: hypothetical protein ACK5Z2_01745 [Bacteroidota bacterium]
MAALLLSVAAFAQRSDFPLLYSYGKIPGDFFSDPQKRAQQSVSKLHTSGHILNKTQVDFIYFSEYEFNRIVQTGQLTFGDSVSLLAGEIADRLLASDTALRNELKFYLFRSYEARIYSFSNGNILITTGLVAKLRTEAQLAYLIAREIIHYRKKNHYTYFTELYQKNRINNIEDALFTLPEDTEREIDKLGVKMLSEAGYDPNQAPEALKNIINYTYFSDESVFDISFFEHDDYIFPQGYRIDQKNELMIDTAQNLAHPGLADRIRTIERYSQLIDSTSVIPPVFNPEVFKRLNLYCAEDQMNQFITHKLYAHAVYAAYSILQKDTTNKQAIYTLAGAFNALSCHRSTLIPEAQIEILILPQYKFISPANEPEEQLWLTKWGKLAGQTRNTAYWLDAMKADELAVLATKWNWRALNVSTGNQKALFRQQTEKIMWMMKNQYQLGIDFFSDTLFIPESPNTNDSISSDGSEVQYNTSRLRTGVAPSTPNKKPILTQAGGQTWNSTLGMDFAEIARMYKKQTAIDDENKIKTIPTVIWRYAPEKEKEQEKYKYTYYIYAFTDLMTDSIFRNMFNRADQLRINKELSYQGMQTGTSGLNADTIIVRYIKGIGLHQYKGTNKYEYDEILTTTVNDKIQKAFRSINKSSIPHLVFIENQKTKNDSALSYSHWCMLQTSMYEIQLHEKNRIYLPVLGYSGIGDHIENYFQSPYVVSTIIIIYRLNIGLPNKVGVLSTSVFDIRSGQLVFYAEHQYKPGMNQTKIRYYIETVYVRMKKPRT